VHLQLTLYTLFVGAVAVLILPVLAQFVIVMSAIGYDNCARLRRTGENRRPTALSAAEVSPVLLACAELRADYRSVAAVLAATPAH
jgi:hypothetical protein